MAYKLSLNKIRKDTLKYLNVSGHSRTELGYIIGVHKTSISRFLSGRSGLQSVYLLNLINLLYYDNKAENRL